MEHRLKVGHWFLASRMKVRFLLFQPTARRFQSDCSMRLTVIDYILHHHAPPCCAIDGNNYMSFIGRMMYGKILFPSYSTQRRNISFCFAKLSASYAEENRFYFQTRFETAQFTMGRHISPTYAIGIMRVFV